MACYFWTKKCDVFQLLIIFTILPLTLSKVFQKTSILPTLYPIAWLGGVGHSFAWQDTHPSVNCSSSCPNLFWQSWSFRAQLSCAGQNWHRVRSKIVKIIKIFEKLEHLKTNGPHSGVIFLFFFWIFDQLQILKEFRCKW